MTGWLRGTRMTSETYKQSIAIFLQYSDEWLISFIKIIKNLYLSKFIGGLWWISMGFSPDVPWFSLPGGRLHRKQLGRLCRGAIGILRRFIGWLYGEFMAISWQFYGDFMAIFMDMFCLGHPKNIITHPFFMAILWWFYGDFHGYFLFRAPQKHHNSSIFHGDFMVILWWFSWFNWMFYNSSIFGGPPFMETSI